MFLCFSNCHCLNRPVNLTIPTTEVAMCQHPFDKLYSSNPLGRCFCAKDRSDIMSTSLDLTPFHVSKNVFIRFLCSSQSSSSLASLRSVTLQAMDFEIRYLAGMRFIDTTKYHGSRLLLLRLSLSCSHTSNDSNFLNSLF